MSDDPNVSGPTVTRKPPESAGPVEPSSGRGFAGLPFVAGSERFQRERDFVTFEIPPKALGMEWQACGRDDKDRFFGIVEVTPDAEDRSASAAGMRQDFGAAFRELMCASIYKIGDDFTRGNRDKVMAWLRDIGPRARKLVERAFNAVNSVDEADAESFLLSAAPDRG